MRGRFRPRPVPLSRCVDFVFFCCWVLFCVGLASRRLAEFDVAVFMGGRRVRDFDILDAFGLLRDSIG